MAALSVAVCLFLGGLMIMRDAGGVPSLPSRRGVVITLVEAVLWIAAAVVAAPTLWELLS